MDKVGVLRLIIGHNVEKGGFVKEVQGMARI